jgi:hypothetical protein
LDVLGRISDSGQQLIPLCLIPANLERSVPCL